MKGDFTRFTFDRKKRYTRVLKQQGRVDLDADWNEQSGIDSYLDRISRMDLSGVENGAPSLKPGFEVTLAPGGTDLSLSPGRFYAEGLICELFDPASFLIQPFYPNPPALAPVDNQTDLVYLDVWQRHITAIEDPSIREVALEGPDTCTRVQTVFQVRIAPNVGAVDCPKAPLPAKSGAFLTTSTVPVPPEDDLCLIGAAGGYKGLENRLYRVEIHAPGALGAATFKWSRDNGSVVFPITEFVAGQPHKIRVKRLGRDQVLTLHEGDFVEVLDDNNELLGQPGTIAQIQSIDAANLELTLTGSALSGPTSGKPGDHPKVRRWDQKSVPIAVAAGPIALEDGIQIEFSGSNFQTGDYWMFAARATDGTIEIQTNKQPQGIRHEYARLALVTWHGPVGGPFSITTHDCRNIFPKNCCCCTVTVGDGSNSKGDFADIQEAIDSLPKTGEFAEVCILPGKYVLARPVTIRRSNVLIHGCGARSIVFGPQAGRAFFVDSASNVSFECLTISPNAVPGIVTVPTIVTHQASELRIVDCLLDTRDGPAVETHTENCLISENVCHGGIRILDGSRNVQIFHNRIEKGRSPGIGIGGTGSVEIEQKSSATGISEVEIRGNRIVSNADSGICTLFENNPKSLGATGITIADNVIDFNGQTKGDGTLMPIAVGGIVLQHARNVRILCNEIDKNGEGRPACGIFLQECSNVGVEQNSIVDNGYADDVIHADCITFQNRAPAEAPNPLMESGVTFTFKDGDNLVAPRFETVNGIKVLGTDPHERNLLVIELPPVDSVELNLLVRRSHVTLIAFNSKGDQLTSAFVGVLATPQRIPLVGSGITRVTLSTNSELLILEFCRIHVPAVSEWQGGILAIVITAEHATGNATPFPAGYPAIRVHDNLVTTPAGQSLLISAIGQVSVEGNSLTSNGARKQPGSFAPPFGVAIYDFGLTYAPQKTLFRGLPATFLLLAGTGSFGFEESGILFDGRIAFEGNQVAYRALNGTIEAGSWAFGIFGLDACQITNNQFRAEVLGRVMASDLVTSGDSVCITGNAFSEIPGTTLFSCFSLGRNMIMTLNQSMHCLLALGSEQTFQQNNQVTISTLCEGLSKWWRAFLTGGKL
jgi:hypothetical protein